MGNIKKVSFSYLFHIHEGFSSCQKITYFITSAEPIIKSVERRVRDKISGESLQIFRSDRGRISNPYYSYTVILLLFIQFLYFVHFDFIYCLYGFYTHCLLFGYTKIKGDVKSMFTKKSLSMVILSGGLVLAGCSANESVSEDKEKETPTQEEKSQVKNGSNGEEQAPVVELSKGEELSNILTSTNWQGTEVYDAEGNNLTEENSNFIGLAKYDQETNRYEFFDKATGETRGDEGIFFITKDGEKRILISQSMGYQAVVDLTEITDEIFTYKRMGVDKDGNEVEVFVEHIPYTESELEFTNAGPELTSETGEIVKDIPGVNILADTLWNGTKVLDKDGNDVTEFNSNFISIAKFDAKTSKYEFFDVNSGESRGDFGYFDVINDNKIRTHVSIGENKYGAALEITELNDDRFTYKRMGKDAAGNDIEIYVEHEPYEGEFNPSFGF